MSPCGRWRSSSSPWRAEESADRKQLGSDPSCSLAPPPPVAREELEGGSDEPRDVPQALPRRVAAVVHDARRRLVGDGGLARGARAQVEILEVHEVRRIEAAQLPQ